ncbi:MAG: mannose-6-phosphate isomerase, class I [Actinomycetota bacterium]|nr:mannose-6-phosphate isomerase, class I [Actinomycetota bacterium]
MRAVRGAAQHYAWGDPTAIPQLLGQAPDGQPWAEWWLGTHPMAPSHLEGGTPLSSVAGQLPYLLKLLAAAQPLSLQTHPDAATARAGFHREEAAGVAMGHPHRIYRDPFAKPELLCALSRFDTLCGFRPVDATDALLREIGADHLAAALRSDGLEATVAGLYRGAIATQPVVAACHRHSSAEAVLVSRLDEQYPGDPSVVVTLLLNRVMLQPGEAVFLGPGNLHAYLRGLGVEIMGASDNVVRGGLTSKHIDVDELLAVLSFEPLPDPVVRPVEQMPGRWRYSTPATPFELWRFEVAGSMPHTAEGRELLLCTDGSAGPLHHGETAYLAPGDSVVLEGPSTVFRVAETGESGAKP